MTITLVKAVNHAGYNVEAWAPVRGWHATSNPHATRDLALTAMQAQQAAEPAREFRVYEALVQKPRADRTCEGSANAA